MTRLLSILILILAIGLFPPATLALISNNAVPGDKTYPIKRGLEDITFAVASLNPVTKAWFAAARSDRRFKEFSTLIAQGKSASNTLNELVTQTEVAASEIKKINDPIRRQQLISQLSQSIDKYDQKLEEVSKTLPSASSGNLTQPTPTPVQTSAPVATPSTKAPTPVVTPKPTVSPQPTPKSQETPRPSVTPAPNTTPAVDPEEAKEARKKFEEIKKRLAEEAKKSFQEKREERREREGEQRGKDKEERNTDFDRDKKHD